MIGILERAELKGELRFTIQVLAVDFQDSRAAKCSA